MSKEVKYNSTQQSAVMRAKHLIKKMKIDKPGMSNSMITSVCKAQAEKEYDQHIPDKYLI